MSNPEHPGHRSQSHYYQDVRVGEGARVQLGDIYNINQEDFLKLLPFAENAPFNSYGRQHEPSCFPNTRTSVLQEIISWAGGQDKRSIFWLSGAAGTGKSTIARTVARKYYDDDRLGASFFFARGGGDVGYAGKFFTSIALQLASQSDTLKSHICKAIARDRDIARKGLRDQWARLIFQPLSKLETRSLQPPFLVIVDALDECDGDKDITTILQCLVDLNSLETGRLYICITSRPETPIRLGFRLTPGIIYRDLVLHNVPRTIVDQDITVFFREKFKELRNASEDVPAGWPGEENISLLVQKAEGLFIYAAIVYRFIKGDDEWPPPHLLNMFLHRASSEQQDKSVHNSPFTSTTWELDDMYIKILEHSFKKVQLQKDKVTQLFKQVVGSLAIVSEPLSAIALSKLLGLSTELINIRLQRLHSILNIPDHHGGLIRLHHPSFRDFLLDKNRCGNLRFWVDEKRAHQTLADGCIRLMSNSLMQDVCRQNAPGTLATSIERSLIEQCLPLELRYACLYWIQHLQKSGAQLYDGGETHRFLQAHLLHWLEALGWMGKTIEGIQAILSLEAHIPVNKSPNLHEFIHDAKRFALHNRLILEQAPLQLYCSALVFAPECSIVRRRFEDYIPHWIQMKPKVQAQWNAAVQVLEGHRDWVSSAAFSPDGQRVVSGSWDRTVRIWDAATGVLQCTLKGHSRSVSSVAFSPDGHRVVSGSDDKTMRLWDTTTGAVQRTLEGHFDWVSSVAFSPDGQRVVSGSLDRTVRIWDAATGALQRTLEGHSSSVYSVAFSPDGQRVVSGSDDQIVQLWDTATGTLQHMLKGHSRTVYSVAFSPDGQRIVSGSDDQTVRLWDAATGALQQTLEGHSRTVYSVSFSPDSHRIVSGSWDRTVRFWDSATGVLQHTIKGHSSSVYSVAFSPDGQRVASGSNDKTVRIWDVATAALQHMPESHSSLVNSVSFSPDGQRVASGSDDQTVRLWDAATGVLQHTLKGHSSSVYSAAFSPDGRRVVSGSGDQTVRLWDVATGVLQRTIKGHSSSVSSVAFSPDGQRVISGSDDQTTRLWDAATGALQRSRKSYWSSVTSVAFSLTGDSRSVYSVAFSPDGQRVVSGSGDQTLQLWDAATGALRRTLEGHFSKVSSAVFSPDGHRVVSGSDDQTIRLWDAATGALQHTLKGHSSSVYSVAFSPDGRRVVSGSGDQTVRFWDVATGVLQRTIKGHSSSVSSVAFSPDGQCVVSGSLDRTARVWDAATGALQRTFEGHSSSVYSVAFSPDGQRVVSGSDDQIVQLWDTATGTLQHMLKGHSRTVYSVSFSPDGQRIVSGSDDRTVRLWDAATGALQRTLEGHLSSVYSVAFSPDGHRVVSGSGDEIVRLWDSATGALQQTLEGHSGAVSSVAFSPDGRAHRLSISDEWIMESGISFFWLPSDYRATSTAIWNNSVVLGHSSGNVSFFKFTQALKVT